MLRSYHTSTAHKSDKVTVDDRFTDVIHRFYSAYTATLIVDTLQLEATSIDWHCYECMKKISVNISSLLRGQKFYGTSLFCNAHKPTNYDHLHTFLFIRYENTFYEKIKLSLLKTSNLE